MELHKKEERLAYVLRGSNRREIYHSLLMGFQIPSQISRKTKIALPNVLRVLKQFEKHVLVKKITSSPTQCTIYQLTQIALDFKQDFLNYQLLYNNVDYLNDK